MLKIEKKPIAFMPMKNNESGHTLLSMLFALSLISITIPFLSLLILNVNDESSYNISSIQHFFYALRDQLIHSHSYDVKSNKLYLYNTLDETITIEKYDTLIRRQVNGTGHEVYLRNVTNLSFEKMPYGLHVLVTLNGGETFEKSIVFYK